MTEIFLYFAINYLVVSNIYIYTRICIICHHHHHHHHLVVPSARISLALSRHPSLSFIASGRSSGLHPVSLQSCSMLVWADRPAFAQPCEGVYRSTSLMSSSLHLQQCSACVVRITRMVFVMVVQLLLWVVLPPETAGEKGWPQQHKSFVLAEKLYHD